MNDGSRARLRFDSLDAERIGATASMLARTFDDDPPSRVLFPDPLKRPRGLADFYARNLRVHLPYRCTQVALDERGEVLATVTLRPPGGVRISKLTMIRHGLVPFALDHGLSAVKRLLWLKDTYEALELAVAEGKPHWYVHMMAVRPDLQGQGVGSRVLEHVLAQATHATEKHAIVLTTHLPQNVAFYRRARFEVSAEQTLQPPGLGPYTVWSMRRSEH